MSEMSAQKTPNIPAIFAAIFGVTTVILAFIPGASFFAWLPAILTLVLAFIGLVTKNKPRALARIGFALGGIGWIVAIIVSVMAITKPSPASIAEAAASNAKVNVFTQCQLYSDKVFAYKHEESILDVGDPIKADDGGLVILYDANVQNANGATQKVRVSCTASGFTDFATTKVTYFTVDGQEVPIP
jgi:hypothetical protein